MWLLVLGLAACGNPPAPVIGGVMPQLVCGSGTLPLAVSGQNFLAQPVRTLAGAVVLEVPSAQLIPSSGTTIFPEVVWYSTQLLSLSVPLDQLASGSYTLEILDPDGQGARHPAALTRIESPPVEVATVAPASLCIADANSSITVQGSGFLPGATVSVRDGAGRVVLHPEATISDSRVTLTLAAGSLQPGGYTLVVENPLASGCAATAAAPLRIDPPPSLIKILSGNVCESGGQIVIQGANLQGGATVQLQLGGQQVTATTVDVTAPDQAIVTFPANNLRDNDHADLFWHNRDGCSALLAAAVRIKPGAGSCN